MTGIHKLFSLGLIETGTIVGVTSSDQRTQHRFQIDAVIQENCQVRARHLVSNLPLVLSWEAIQEIDGMSLSRYLDHADLDQDGLVLNRGKKRGRRPKPRI